MITKQEDENLGFKLIAIANVARKANLIADKKIAEAIAESRYTEYSAAHLIEFVEIFRRGTPKEEIIRELRMSPELVQKFDKYNLAW